MQKLEILKQEMHLLKDTDVQKKTIELKHLIGLVDYQDMQAN